MKLYRNKSSKCSILIKNEKKPVLAQAFIAIDLLHPKKLYIGSFFNYSVTL